MMEPTHGTLTREEKGPMAPAPPLPNPLLAAVADAVASWPRVVASAHWSLLDPSRMDGIDFYVGPHELGHIHLDGSIHLATSPTLGASLIDQGKAERFPFARGWVQQRIARVGSPAAIELFRRNYDRLVQFP